MTKAQRFRRMIDKLFKVYANSGLLYVPQDNGLYDPDTGDTEVVYGSFPVKYVPYPLNTDPKSDFGLSAFKDSKVTFYVSDISVVVNETCFIEGIDGLRWDIFNLNTITSNDLIVAYEADVKAHI